MSSKLVDKIEEYDHIIHHLKQERRFFRKEYDYIKKMMNPTETFPPYKMEDTALGSFQLNEHTFKQRSLYFSKLFHAPVTENGDNNLKLKAKIEELPPKKLQSRPKTRDKNVMVGKSGCGKIVDRHFSGGFFMFIICLI